MTKQTKSETRSVRLTPAKLAQIMTKFGGLQKFFDKALELDELGLFKAAEKLKKEQKSKFRLTLGD